MLVEVRDAIFGYQRRPVVQVQTLDLHAGRCLGVFGPNGVGKTTLVRGITRLLAPLSGTVACAQELRLGYLPQQRAMELHWPMSGLDAAAMAVSARSRMGWLQHSDATLVLSSMDRMGVRDLAAKPFAKLSGGQQQRILLAGALAADPNVLVLDEPTDGLDVRSRTALLDILRAHVRAGLCTVVISHDVEDLVCLADQIAWLHPPSEPSEPSCVEVITPDAFKQHVTQIHRTP